MGKNLAPTIGVGPFDKVLIAGFAENLTAEQVSVKTGGVLTPAQCLDRVVKILDSKDALSQVYKKKLILENAYLLSGRLTKQIQDAEWIDKDSASVYMKTMESLMKMIDSASVDIDAAMTQLRRDQAVELVLAVRTLSDIISQALAADDIVEAEVIEDAVEKALPIAIGKISFNE